MAGKQKLVENFKMLVNKIVFVEEYENILQENKKLIDKGSFNDLSRALNKMKKGVDKEVNAFLRMVK